MTIFQDVKRGLKSGLSNAVGVDRRNWDWAVTSAFAAFAGMHPEWAASLFDLHFLTHRAQPILEQYARGDLTDPATALANAWADQLSHEGEVRAWRVRELIPVASDFLCLFKTELARLNTNRKWAQGQSIPVEAWPCKPYPAQ
jgi:hypothetical protein